jgi:cobyrinic acid a,c-diamide synthase
LGHQLLDQDIRIAGVVLNNVASTRQADKQAAAIDYYCKIPVIGALPRSSEAGIKERHLGLVTVHEISRVDQVIAELGKIVAENCDLERVQSLAGKLMPYQQVTEQPVKQVPTVKIGVAYDSSFCFYYQDNFEALEAAGAELVFFNTLKDTNLPNVDAVYIGGGFPESFLQELENNNVLRRELKQRIEQGMPVYAECGGLMYLTRSIERDGIRKEMVGVIPADVLFQKKPVGKGYTELKPKNQTSWFNPDRVIKGHEFHYSRLINLDRDLQYNYSVQRGTGIDGLQDGIILKNVLASYTHIHAAVVPDWARAFVSVAKRYH